MEIKHSKDEKGGKFFIEQDGSMVADLTYVMAGPEKMIIDHTKVDDSLGGKGVGKQLVEKAVNYAREQKIKILPLCPFAKKLFDKIPEYGDVLF